MMKSTVTGVVLGGFVLLSACTRVHVEIPQPAGESETHTPPPGKEDLRPDGLQDGPPAVRGAPGAVLRSNFIVLAQAGEKPCATDRNVTSAVAQETGVWCWAASAQGVMSFHKVDLPQCITVNKIKAPNRTEQGMPYCCAGTNIFEAPCQQNGWTDEVFDAFGIDYRWRRGPLSQRRIGEQLCGNGPFTYSIAYQGGGGHTFVVKDYRMEDGEMSLWVDAHEYFTDTEGKRFSSGFKKLSYKKYAEGWYDGMSNTIDFTYVLINQTP